MKLKRKYKLILVFILFVILVSSILFIMLRPKITFSLNGEEVFVLNLADEYSDPGVIAKKCNVFSCKDISENVNVLGEVNNNIVGKYVIQYKLNYKNEEKIIERTINVIETIAPVIELKGKTELNICPNKEYAEEGFSAVDNYDGDITNKVTKEIIDDTIYYRVSDSSNNMAEAKRVFVYTDEEKPVITLKGNSVTYLEVGNEYSEAGYKVTDNCDANIADKLSITNNVDTSKTGEYEVKYTAVDTKGNSTTVTRKVYVYNFNTKDKDEYAKSLDYYIKGNGWNISVGYINITNNYTYKYNANEVYYGASLIKTLDAMYVYEKMNVTSELKALVKPTIEKSNNTTHRQLVDKIELSNLRAYGVSLGAKNVLNRSATDYFGNTTIDDQLIYMQHLYEVINTNPLGNELKNYFINDYTNHLLFDGIPTTMHKYGWFGKYYHDVGIVLDDSPYIIVVLTAEAYNTMDEEKALQKSSKIVNDISQKIYNFNKLM